jgi:hypothetical protein
MIGRKAELADFETHFGKNRKMPWSIWCLMEFYESLSFDYKRKCVSNSILYLVVASQLFSWAFYFRKIETFYRIRSCTKTHVRLFACVTVVTVQSIPTWQILNSQSSSSRKSRPSLARIEFLFLAIASTQKHQFMRDWADWIEKSDSQTQQQ